ncbi:MAG: thiamine pyrophosphate-dependent dehydrogenase E1 component subunit alpha [Elusimicrobia bacterium]|nr:thiamine pyrophosphate-dependent dehydrogenase E1 component subunit alpha [Elusimicrobiota bacterium]
MIQYPYQGKGYEFYRDNPTEYPRDFLQSLFRSMLRIRRVELEVERRYPEDQMKTPIHLVIGQEAACVGSAAALRPTDLVYCGHRTHGVYLAKGGDLKAMIAEFFCKSTGCVGSRGGSMHLLDKSVGMAGTSAIVAGAVPITAGMALAAQLLKKDTVCMVVLGDAATEEGATSESLNFAALKKLPMIFFCENNFYSVQSPLKFRQPEGVEIHRRSSGFGMRGVCVDGNNVLDVHQVTKEAVDRARRGDGPTFIEVRTYRCRAHGGAGDDSATGYRDPKEVEAWIPHCPVEMMSNFLVKNNLMTLAERSRMEEEIGREIQEAFAFAQASPEPSEEDAMTHIYQN